MTVTREEVRTDDPEVYSPIEEKETQATQPPTTPEKPASVDRSQMSNEWKRANPQGTNG